MIDTEIVIPVHDLSRPVRRAAESVLADPAAGVIVVAHNIATAELDLPKSDRLRVISLTGFPGKPGAAFDAGIAAAEKSWVGIMGSDDWLAPGALVQMRQRAQDDRADGVISPLRHEGTGPQNPILPVTWRRTGLQAVQDRMFYRSAPLGIYRTEIMQDSRYRFGAEFPSGEDLRMSTLLWTSGLKFSYYWDDPAYVVGNGASGRITLKPRPLPTVVAPYLNLMQEPGVQAFTAEQQHALASKLARVHVCNLVRFRTQQQEWQADDFACLVSYVQKLRDFDPFFDHALTRRDNRIVAAIERADMAAMLVAAAVWKDAGAIDRVFTAGWLANVTERDSSLRTALASFVAKGRTYLYI